MLMFKNMKTTYIFFIILFPLVGMAKDVNYGSVCLGPNLSKVPEKTWIKINSSEKFKTPSGEVKLIINQLDLSKVHTVTVFVKSGYTKNKTVKAASWRFRFKDGGTNMVSIFRSTGGWQLFQNKVGNCEYPITGCGFKYICK